jgi:ribosomal protein S18 acetylase RimI-like enzyme
MNITVEEITNLEQKSKITENILRKLPNWFELEQGILDFIDGVKNKPFFVAKNNEETAGFIVIEDHNKWSSEIYVMGVLPEYRNQGIGHKLVESVWNRNQKLGKKYLIVKTLDESADDLNYNETRKFYEKVGFIPLFATTDIWGIDNPCLVMLKDN